MTSRCVALLDVTSFLVVIQMRRILEAAASAVAAPSTWTAAEAAAAKAGTVTDDLEAASSEIETSPALLSQCQISCGILEDHIVDSAHKHYLVADFALE